MERNNKKGFTLIELLVVIAIIGILSAVVLASLNTARQRGSDANITSNLNNMRPQAELYFTDQSPMSYTGVCTAAASDNGIAGLLAGAQEQAAAVCVEAANGSAWAAEAPLSTGEYYCVDSTGAAVTGAQKTPTEADASCS